MLHTEREYLLEAYANNKEKLEVDYKIQNKFMRFAKATQGADYERNRGNKLFRKKAHPDWEHFYILHCYNRSIALSPTGSEHQAMGYSNRSAYLMHLKKFEEGVKDIDRALDITTSKVLKVKLLCRKVECLKAIGLTYYDKILGTAKSYFAMIENKVKDEHKLIKIIEKAETCPVNAKTAVNVQELRNENKIKEFLSKKELTKIPDSIKICYNEKYGRHLIANKPFEPGEILFVENMYAHMMYPEKFYTHCNYCSKICWCGIPCELCGWGMFCDDECKKKSWDKLHDIECSLIPHYKLMGDDDMNDIVISVRMLVLAMKEFGDVEHLRSELETFDKSPDNVNKGFVKNGQFFNNSFISIYSLTSDTYNKMLKSIAYKVIHVLTCIEERTSFLGENVKTNTVADLMKNENALFLGSLLIRLIVIQTKNANLLSSTTLYCPLLRYHKENETDICCDYGHCIAPFSSLINHSCNPNVSRCFTQDHKIIVYTVQPIAKNSQLFDNYYREFYKISRTSRIEHLSRLHNFNCDCKACLEDWPQIIRKEYVPKPIQMIEFKITKEVDNILLALDKRDFIDQKDLKKICKAIVKMTKHVKQPSQSLTNLIDAFQAIFSNLYGLKPCPYGVCDKVQLNIN